MTSEINDYFPIILIVLSSISLILILMCLLKRKDMDDNVDISDIEDIDDIDQLRDMIDKVDRNIVRNIHKRSMIVKRIWQLKGEKGIPRYDSKRENQILKNIKSYAKELDLQEDKVVNLHASIIGGHFHKK